MVLVQNVGVAWLTGENRGRRVAGALKAGRRVTCSSLSSNLSQLGPSTGCLCLSASGQAGVWPQPSSRSPDKGGMTAPDVPSPAAPPGPVPYSQHPLARHCPFCLQKPPHFSWAGLGLSLPLYHLFFSPLGTGPFCLFPHLCARDLGVHGARTSGQNGKAMSPGLEGE